MYLTKDTAPIEQISLDLVTHGAEIGKTDRAGETPLSLAAFRNHTKLVAKLLQMGADPNTRNCVGATPLHVAASFGRVQIARMLLKGGAVKNVAGKRREDVEYPTMPGDWVCRKTLGYSKRQTSESGGCSPSNKADLQELLEVSSDKQF